MARMVGKKVQADRSSPSVDGPGESKGPIEHELPAKSFCCNIIDKFDQYEDAEEQDADVGRIPAEHDIERRCDDEADHAPLAG